MSESKELARLELLARSMAERMVKEKVGENLAFTRRAIPLERLASMDRLALVPLWVGFFRILAMTAILCTTIILFTVDNYLFFFRILAMTTTTEFLCAAISYNVVN